MADQEQGQQKKARLGDPNLPIFVEKEKAIMRKCLESWGVTQFAALGEFNYELLEYGEKGVHMSDLFSDALGTLVTAPAFWGDLKFFQFALKYVYAIRRGEEVPKVKDHFTDKVTLSKTQLATKLDEMFEAINDEEDREKAILQTIEEVSKPILPKFHDMFKSQWTKDIKPDKGRKLKVQETWITLADLTNLIQTWNNFAAKNGELSAAKAQKGRKFEKDDISIEIFQRRKLEGLLKCTMHAEKPVFPQPPTIEAMPVNTDEERELQMEAAVNEARDILKKRQNI